MWARPALLVVAALAGWAYAHDASDEALEVYDAAAVRSMASTRHNFFYASFDPARTLSIDKLPGAAWIQALSVRLFGLHTWSIVAPQVIVLAVSLSWMTFVSAHDQATRPYVDGSSHDSVFDQVFVYNALGRVGSASAGSTAGDPAGLSFSGDPRAFLHAFTVDVPAGPTRLLEKIRQGATSLFAGDTAIVASPIIYGTGDEVLPIGGFTGDAPVPSIDDLQQGVATGRLRLALLPPAAPGEDARLGWIRTHCVALPPTATLKDLAASTRTALLTVYACRPT